MGCTDATACNYDEQACTDDGSCVDETTCNSDCSDGGILEFWDAVNCRCAPAQMTTLGCMDETANNYNPNANCDDGSCNDDILGCTDPCAGNYNPDAEVDDNSCDPYDIDCNSDCMIGDVEVWNTEDCACRLITVSILGCTNDMANNYNPDATCNDGSCDFSEPAGCTDPCAGNYNPDVMLDDGSCETYDMDCNIDCTMGDLQVWNPETCACQTDMATVLGCMDDTACNYNPDANCDDASCDFGDDSCAEPCNPACAVMSEITSEPCDCENPNNIDLDNDGQIDLIEDLITITGAEGLDWILSGGIEPIVLNEDGSVRGTQFSLPEVSPGVYELPVYHPADGTGFGELEFESSLGEILTFASEGCACTDPCPDVPVLDNPPAICIGDPLPVIESDETLNWYSSNGLLLEESTNSFDVSEHIPDFVLEFTEDFKVTATNGVCESDTIIITIQVNEKPLEPFINSIIACDNNMMAEALAIQSILCYFN